jgi:predicted amidophosphoribosyltransferase
MSSLGASERRRNIQNVFSLRHDKIGKPEGKRILLVDDIYTTGSTADACVSVLLEAGASEVFPYAFASGSNRIK